MCFMVRVGSSAVFRREGIGMAVTADKKVHVATAGDVETLTARLDRGDVGSPCVGVQLGEQEGFLALVPVDHTWASSLRMSVGGATYAVAKVWKTAGSVGLSTDSVSLDTSTPTATVTVTKVGDGAVSAVSSDPGVATVSVSGDVVTVTGVATGSATVTVNVAEGTDYLVASASFSVDAAMATVYGMVLTKEGGGSGTWVRVDEDFNTVAFDASKHGTWSKMRTVTDGSDVLVEIPTTWVKTEVIDGGVYDGKTCYWIADGPVDGFHVHPAFMKTDGTAGVLRVGAYMASKGIGNVPMSVETTSFWTNITRSALQSTAATKNTGGRLGYRPYSIYDHHLLARMMITEFGTTDVRSGIAQGSAYNARLVYRGVRDVLGSGPRNTYCWLDGLTMENGTYHVLSPTGSGQMIDTGVEVIGNSVYPKRCRMDVANGVDFGDLFIASEGSARHNSDAVDVDASFAGGWQARYTGYAWSVGAYWANSSTPLGLFFLNCDSLESGNANLSWRFVQVV